MDKKGVEPKVDMVTVSFNDLMALARQIIAEQLHDCNKEFMAGRAHGVSSFHSGILQLSKRTALAETQGENAASLAPRSTQSEANEALTPGRSEASVARKHSEDVVGEFQAAARQAQLENFMESTRKMAALNREMDENMLSAALWLYRRLSLGFGRVAVVEGPIQRLADKLGINIDQDLAERGPAPADDKDTQ